MIVNSVNISRIVATILVVRERVKQRTENVLIFDIKDIKCAYIR